MKIAIITSQQAELEQLIEPIEHKTVIDVCGRVFYEFELDGVAIVAVFSHWGKVAAAITSTILLEHFAPNFVVSIGLGNAVVPGLSLGDVVIGQHLFQHDLDMRPTFRRYEVPLSGSTSCLTREHDQQLAADAVHTLLKTDESLRLDLLAYGVAAPKLYLGDMACGDLLVAGASRKAAINRNLPSVLCVDMECGAMAQVCLAFAVPFVFVRIVGDTANETSDSELTTRFRNDMSVKFGIAILKQMIRLGNKE